MPGRERVRHRNAAESFDPTTALVLNLCGTLVFGISGGLAGVRARLDPFGVVVLAAVVGMAGGIVRDVLIAAEAVVLGAISGIGGGILRDVIVREVPHVLRSGLYAIPAIIGATIVVVAQLTGGHGVAFPLIGALACFGVRMAGIRYDLNLPPRGPA